MLLPRPPSHTTHAPWGPAEGAGATGCRRRVRASLGLATWSIPTQRHLSSGCKRAAPLTQKLHLCTLYLWPLLLGSGGCHISCVSVTDTDEATLPDRDTLSWLSFQKNPIPGSPHTSRPPGGRPHSPTDLPGAPSSLECDAGALLPKDTPVVLDEVMTCICCKMIREEGEVGEAVEDAKLAKS